MRGNDADLGLVQKNLESAGDRRAADMALALGPWRPGGAMGRLFEGGDTPALDAALTVFELAELKGRGDLQGVVLMLVVFPRDAADVPRAENAAQGDRDR